MVRKKVGRGGKRPGAGRPRTVSDPVELKIVFEREQVAWIDEVVDSEGLTRAKVVRWDVDLARDMTRTESEE